MKLENRAPAEGINASRENPLKELAWLLAGGLGVVVLLVFTLSFAAQWIAPRIPYKYEAKLAASLPPFATTPDNASGRQVQAELQSLADRLAARLDMPDEMIVRVGYREQDTVNAFATLGGQAVFFRGLLGKIDNEDALAMVMAHELAHLKYRHASAALGRGVAVGVILSIVSADLGSRAAGNVLTAAGMATLLSFNRDQEREADDAALRALHAEYGHVGGAIDLFNVMMQLPGGGRPSSAPAVEFLRTHPLTESRLAAIKQWSLENGAATDGPRRPLPPGITALRRTARSDGEKSELRR